MNTNRPLITRSAAVLATSATICGGLLTSSANADVAVAEFNSLIDWHYDLRHMPDIDQQRNGPNGLPNDGRMYCAPTSAVNMFTYAANHGFPGIMPGDVNAQSQSNFEVISDAIGLVGAFMQCDPQNGTGGSTWRSGAAFTLELGAPGAFTTTSFYQGNGYSPRLFEIAQTAVNGSLIAFCFGRYDIIGQYDGMPLVSRASGHCVTLNKTVRDGVFDQKVWYRDPGDDGINDTQSQFQSSMFDINLLQIARSANDDDTYWVSNFDATFGDGRLRVIDGYISVRPKGGYSFTENGIFLINPALLGGIGGITTVPVPTHDGHQVLDILLHNELNDFLILHSGDEAGPEQLFRFSPMTGEEVLVASLAGARQIVTGRCRELYVLTDTTIEVHRQIDNSTEYELVGSVLLPTEVDTIEFDDTNDEIVAISSTREQILRYPKMLPAGVAPTVAPLPAGLPLGDCVAMAIAPDGKIWLASDNGGQHIICAEEQKDGSMLTSLIDVESPIAECCVTVDDMGHPFVRTTAGLVELEPDGNGGWSILASSPFAGLSDEGCFHVHRSRTNFDPTIHEGPEWNNIDPEELEFGTIVADCDWDIDGDGDVGVNDLLRLLAAWGTDDGLSDLDGSGLVDVTDLLDLLAHWGDCP